MPNRIILGTDIAMIGLWDPELEQRDIELGLGGQSNRDQQKACEQGKLFLLQTESDGDHVVDVYINELPAADLMEAYQELSGPFLVLAPSGRLQGGGAEDFRQAKKVASRPEDEFSLPPGRYALSSYSLDDQRLERKIVGDEDFEYFQKRRGGCPWGCLLFVLVLVACYFEKRIAIFFLTLLVLRLAFSLLVWVSRLRDEKLKEIQAKIDVVFEDYDQFPPFLFVLESIGDQNTLSGGQAAVY